MEGGVGRAAIAPEILFALWLFAALEGIGSARGLARLTQAHDTYRWICGGVQVNHHTLSDFRSLTSEFLDDLLSASLANLMAVGVLRLQAVAQDGMRVRAGAGAGSFRRKERLEGYLDAAKERVAERKKQLDDDPAADSRRRKAARERAAKERESRIQAALDRRPELAEIKQRQDKPPEEARASSPDADATVMKMGDGGFRPAYNLQYGTDVDSQIIVGVDGVTSGSDQGQRVPMVEQVSERCGQTPEQWRVDGGYPAHDQLDAVADQTEVLALVPKPKKPKEGETPDPHAPKAGDSTAVKSWRGRMATDETKERYQDRAATAECVNAQARNRGLQRLPVRGLNKVKGEALLFALAHNLMRMAQLVPEWFGIGIGTSATTEMVG